MARIRQLITGKRKAKNKNAKYVYSIKKVFSQSKNKKTSNKKYSYTKKITVNGKSRYYYA